MSRKALASALVFVIIITIATPADAAKLRFRAPTIPSAWIPRTAEQRWKFVKRAALGLMFTASLFAAPGQVPQQPITRPTVAAPVRTLSGRPFISATTFSTRARRPASRQGTEIEAVRAVSGIDGRALQRLLLQTNGRGRSVFERLRAVRAMEAFSLGYPLNEIPWDEASHRAREASPLLSLTIEDGRFEPNGSGRRELSLGTDIFDEVYVDDPNFVLLQNDLLLRGRARWDDARSIRRTLIQAKLAPTIDASGIKRATKVEDRYEGLELSLGALTKELQSGVNSSERPIAAVAAVYQQVAPRLGDIEGQRRVLLLDPKLYLRSIRSRYHLRETRTSALLALHQHGWEQMVRVLDLIRQGAARGAISATDEARLNDLGHGILEGHLLLEQARARLPAANLDVHMILNPQTVTTVERDRVIAEVTSGLYHEFARQVAPLVTQLVAAGDQEQLRISLRQIEAAGTARTQIWFGRAKEIYVPGASAVQLIDTIDMTQMMTVEQWNAVPEIQRNPGLPIPNDRVFHALLSNDVQLELDFERPYLERLRRLRERLQADPNNAELTQQLARAQSIFDEVLRVQKLLAELKGPSILEELRAEGAPQAVRWDAITDSKGAMGLRPLRGTR